MGGAIGWLAGKYPSVTMSDRLDGYLRPDDLSIIFTKYLSGCVIESRPSPEHQSNEVNKPCLILHKCCMGRLSDGVIRLIYVLSIAWRVETISLHFQCFDLLPPAWRNFPPT